ncbi:HIV Tat-specific factor 1 [Otolemur garnettii]|uniref:HIV Tat-specific factor 1 n=1 Tax=Otolemur garnettii TaxID=30611 RepID=UPI0002742A52|nr:HIV Tat-specific factor 1 [Otolemur garnettii]XP_023364282.1 HIV Tat-specific factor 1 [Otolemur garnettii]
MSDNKLSGNDEFDEQLRMQELYGDAKDSDTQKDPSGETNSFGQHSSDTPYEWDLDKKAWFPKITDDFIATYQANYGFSNDGASSSTSNIQDVNTKSAEEPPQRQPPEPTDSRRKGEKRKAESGWFQVEEDRNTNVYVSGLPPDITVDEFIQLMSKFGIIMRDPQTEEFKVKLYKDNQGNLKGDGLCCYLKRESVELALKLLDEDEIRGYKLHVEVAKFQLKGTYDASKKKKKCKDYKKKLSLQQKQLDWRPERRAGPSRMRHERVVIIKNMFHPMDFEDDPLVLNEIREDLRVECSKFGQIRKLLLFDRHPDGVASVSFRDAEEADYCIHTLNGRWFGGRQITAEAWDGTTDYQVEETSREREERLRGWEAFLNTPEDNRGFRRSNSVCTSERAGPSRVRHFSEHPSTSKMNAQEAATGMAFEEPIDEKKFEKTEDGGEFEEDASEKAAKEGGPEKEAEEGCPEKESEEGYPTRESEGGRPKREREEGTSVKESEEDSPKKEAKENVPERESKKKRFTDDYEENGLAKESEDDPNKESEEESDPKKESEEDDSERELDEDCSEKPSEDVSEKEFEENGLEKDFDEDGSEKDLDENVLDKELGENDSEDSELEDDVSEKVLDEEGSERELEEDSDEKEEDAYDKVFDDESDEKEEEDEEDGEEKGLEDADEKEEDDDADEKLFEDSDDKEYEDDADGKEDDPDEKLFEDDDSKDKLFEEEEEEESSEKLFDDSDEKGIFSCLGSIKEEGALSTDSSFVLSSDDDDDDI